MENVALVYVELPNSDVQQDLYELKELIRTAEGTVKLDFSQKRNSIDKVTVLGSGKLEELANTLKMYDDINVVIFSCPLSSTQRTTLKDKLDVDILDKIDLILDIFALRASSAEGKKQVELAQLTYSLATKPEGNFSRQGAGIGTRGPGETMLETNKRLARDRIHHLKLELKEIEQRRALTRKQREQNDVFTIALVGYTNAGKSTLFNLITQNNVYADDKLFATLDTTVRKCTLDCGIDVLFCDTVGFIKDLPPSLFNAFKSTLEETAYADLLIEVFDGSDANVGDHIAVTEQTLAELNATTDVIRVFNKCDKENFSTQIEYTAGSACVYASAKTGKNIDMLMSLIESFVLKKYAKLTLRADIALSGKLMALVSKYSKKFDVNYDEQFVLIDAIINRKYIGIFSEYIYHK